ncbi:MAG: single-stranded-DNA-specific exonuclease RecJ [Rhodospirillales bacterium]|nr:MAG: single-stranded-DNA-specific exonuclease RecJ [Rhodospirillales bacterium]
MVARSDPVPQHLPGTTDPDGIPLLGVVRSASGRRWLARGIDERVALAIAQRLEVPEVVGRILAGRGVDLGEAEAFLNPTLRQALPDPSRLVDMDKGAERLARAIVGDEPVTVFADYDVDGATSAALVIRFFRALGREIGLYVPDRIGEGYGPSAAAMAQLRRDGAAVVVTVDCGISAHEALAEAAALGLDVVVLDHHTVEPPLPEAVAVINPRRPDDRSGQGHLAAVGVTFLMVVAINRTLRAQGYYARRSEPDLRQWLDLVALGTLCDLVPLVGLNRALVVQGLKVMRRWSNRGLRALADVAGLNEVPGPYHAGFLFGPRINAAGRVGEAGLGARLLASDDGEQVVEMARRLEQANRARRDIEGAVLSQALVNVAAEADGPDGASVLMAAGEDWHPGVVGIVASRLVERFRIPACVVAIKDGIGTGSGRSVPGCDLGAAIIAARRQGLLLRGGGHAMAVGFSVAVEGLDTLRRFLEAYLAASVQATRSRPSLLLDGALALGGASASLADLVAGAGPFGIGNPEPRFAVTGARVLHAALVRGGHVRCVLGDQAGMRRPAIAFRSADGPVGNALLRHDGAPLHVAGRLRNDARRATPQVQIHIDDVAPLTAG